MRARAGLAGALLKLGEDDAAISHYRNMLQLNPGTIKGSGMSCWVACSGAAMKQH